MKTETLEEAAIRLVKETTLYGNQEASIGSSNRSYFETELRCVLVGMKWQQERSYSEEEVLVILHKRDMYEWEEENEILSVTDWFEQFKKK